MSWFKQHFKFFNISMKPNHGDSIMSKSTLNLVLSILSLVSITMIRLYALKVPLKTGLSMVDGISYLNFSKLSISTHESRLLFFPMESEFHRLND